MFSRAARIIWSALLALWAMAMPVAAGSSISFTLDRDGHIILPLEVGGVEAPCFILDTATRRFGVTNQMADRLWAERVYRGSITHVSAGGSVRLPLAKLHRIHFGDHEIETGYAAIYPDTLPGTDSGCGLLGFDAYHGYVMRLEGPARRVTLTAHSGNLARAGWRLIAAEYNSQGALLIDTEYRGQTITVMLATGLTRTMLDRTAAHLLFPERLKGDTVPTLKAHDVATARIGLLAPEKAYDTLLLPDLAVAGWQLGEVEALIAPLQVREQTGYRNAALLMLGADILAHKDFALDTRAHQLWVPPAGGMQETATE